ncbi:hypothetical protein EON82_12935 [bacterium]|nr:MAG: hypothetical protein EON82_12935 [bacterium]
MRFFSASAGLVVLALLGFAGFGRVVPSAKSAPAGAVESLDGVFRLTQNLRGGVGVRSATQSRRPGIPTFFHVRDAARNAPAKTVFSHSDDLGLWTLDGPEGSRFFADAKKRVPAGHLSITIGPVAKIDAEFAAGTLAGIAYRRTTKLNADGSGTEAASGKHPLYGRYSLKGHWHKGNFGTWIQHWERTDGSWETETFQNLPGGTSLLKVTSGSNLAMELTFATDLSGQGTVTDCRTGAKAKIEWDQAGDGKVVWENGATLEFEDWGF